MTCSVCRKNLEYGPDWTIEDAKKRYEEEFGVPFKEDEVFVVCEACHQELILGMILSTQAEAIDRVWARKPQWN